VYEEASRLGTENMYVEAETLRTFRKSVSNLRTLP
jgi:hypothetical protein